MQESASIDKDIHQLKTFRLHEVHDGRQIDVSDIELEVGDIDCPYLIRITNPFALQEVGIDWVLVLRYRCHLMRRESFQTHLMHQPPSRNGRR